MDTYAKVPKAKSRLPIFAGCILLCIVGVSFGWGHIKNSSPAQYCLARVYLYGAERGFARAQDNLALMYEEGRGRLPKDETQAVSWYRKAAEQGNADAQTNLGFMYVKGRGGLTKDETQAVSWYRKAAEQGNADAQTNLGFMYVKGRGGLPKDETQAVSWYRKAAEQRNAFGQAYLASMYEEGHGGLNKDEAQAVSLYRKAAEQGLAYAQFSLGSMYRDGRGGLAKDETQAVSWFRKAAEQGDADAQNNLGFMYENGRGGLTKDDAQAVSWYRKAAEQGNEVAQTNLGLMYKDGRGGLAKDDSQATLWWGKAAEQGNAHAQNLLASEACKPLLARLEEMDNGANWDGVDEGERTAPIRNVGGAASPDDLYAKTVDCYRRENFSTLKPDFAYAGMGEFRNTIKFGMSPPEAAQALPMLPQELVGTAAPYDINKNPYLLHWVFEGCVNTQPAMERYTKAKESCLFSKPITGSPAMVAITDAPFPDNVTLDFDAVGPAGKLLGWHLMTSVPIKAYKTTDAVIRNDRSNTELNRLGPPNQETGTHAVWYFFSADGKRELESVDLMVMRKGPVFIKTLSATDVENEKVEQ